MLNFILRFQPIANEKDFKNPLLYVMVLIMQSSVIAPIGAMGA